MRHLLNDIVHDNAALRTVINLRNRNAVCKITLADMNGKLLAVVIAVHLKKMPFASGRIAVHVVFRKKGIYRFPVK